VPTVRFAGQSIECLAGANLRMILLRARLPLYHNVAKALHCRGFGTCGTCAVRVEGPVSGPTDAELRRMSFPPHNRASGLRLACQISVLGDVDVTKFEGLFGQRTDAKRAGPEGANS
jgi:ferredoxin